MLLQRLPKLWVLKQVNLLNALPVFCVTAAATLRKTSMIITDLWIALPLKKWVTVIRNAVTDALATEPA